MLSFIFKSNASPPKAESKKNYELEILTDIKKEDYGHEFTLKINNKTRVFSTPPLNAKNPIGHDIAAIIQFKKDLDEQSIPDDLQRKAISELIEINDFDKRISIEHPGREIVNNLNELKKFAMNKTDLGSKT